MIFLDLDNCPFRYEHNGHELGFAFYTGNDVKFTRKVLRPIYSRVDPKTVVGYSEYENSFSLGAGKDACFLTLHRTVGPAYMRHAYDIFR